MRTETIVKNFYKFNELNEDQKQKAIELVRSDYYQHNDFAEQAVDDDYLFEPPHAELVELFGEDFYTVINERYKYKDRPMIGNTRKDIYFNCEHNYRHLDAVAALEINSPYYFKKWLGIPEAIINDVTFALRRVGSRYPNTEIELELAHRDFSASEQTAIEYAEEKFKMHMGNVLRNISDTIDERFTDNAITEDIEANEREFEVNDSGEVISIA